MHHILLPLPELRQSASTVQACSVLPPLTTTITLTTTAALVSCLLDGMWQHTVSKSASDPDNIKSAADIFKTELKSLSLN